MKKETLSGRGGKMPGAGRPKGAKNTTYKTDKKKPCSFKLSEEEEIAVRNLLATMRKKQ